MKNFFISCNLKFEDELENELREVWPFLLDLDGRPHANELKIIEKIPGGLLLEAPLHLGLQLNSFCKLANRILLRISEFRVRDFPKMHQKLKSLARDPFLKEKNLKFQIAASKSRLNNEKRIEEICQEIFPSVPGAEFTDTLYLRMFDDLCTVSLDTTGEHLHFRSQKSDLGKAPVRETLAAFCLRQMVSGFSRTHLQEISLVDPMLGTGTFLKEAQSLYSRTDRKDFAFKHWSQTPKLLTSKDLEKNDLSREPLFKALYGYDRDPQVLNIAKEQLLGVVPPENIGLQDVFQKKPVKNFRSWVILNPPYGERIKADFTAGKLFRTLIDVYNPEQLGLILSEGQYKELLKEYEQIQDMQKPAEERMHLKGQWPFSNGGIAVRFVLFSRFVEDCFRRSTF
jgi:putative N6-adenine-specific DNA methylase